MKRERLLLAAVIFLALAFLTSVGILFYYITHSQNLAATVQKSVEQELKKYNIPTKELTVDESKLVLAIARYCAVGDNCRGPQGDTGLSIQGSPGKVGLAGSEGQKGADAKNGTDGQIGKDGKDGEPGQQGEKGEPGPRTERRCRLDSALSLLNNDNRYVIDWRNEGDENWQVEYYLGPSQTCPTLLLR